MSESGHAVGKLWRARNLSHDAGEGSIHDDETASALGFRGGTVAGSVHFDLCAAHLVEQLGPQFFERGAISLYFTNATIDGEAVRASSGLADERGQSALWVHREDGMEVAAGTASLGDHERSALKVRDLRPAPPSEMKILAGLEPGMPLGEWRATVDNDLQFERLDAGLISDPLDWYRHASPWGGPVAAYSLLIELLWRLPTRDMKRGDAVILFGAIEVAQHAGPVMLDQDYRITAEVVSLAQSPRTESFWFDAFAYDDGGTLVASQRMMLRFMKSSSPLYR